MNDTGHKAATNHEEAAMKAGNIYEPWRQAKQAQIKAGYATQYDRRTAELIRQRQHGGLPVTVEQLAFAAKVEEIIR